MMERNRNITFYFFFILKFIDFTSQINANKQLIGILNAGKPALEK